MEIFDIVCRECRSHDFKYIDGKPTCQGCGYVLTDKNVEDILHQAYKESFAQCTAEKLRKGQREGGCMDNLVYETGNRVAKVKVFTIKDGYIIESFMSDRKPQTIRSTYKNNRYFNEKTKWHQGLILLHGIYEHDGLIAPVDKLN